MNKKSLETLSDRLLYALKQTGLRPTHVANQLHMSRQTMRHLCNAKVQQSRYTYQIADLLGINPRWLAKGEGEMFMPLPAGVKHAPSFPPVPLLTLANIPCWLSGKQQQTVRTHPDTQWLIPASDLGLQGFACHINDKALFPFFDMHTVVFVNPDLVPQSHRFVVAYLSEIDDVMIRQYEENSSLNSLLKPINAKLYNTVNLTSQDKILGVIVEVRWSL